MMLVETTDVTKFLNTVPLVHNTCTGVHLCFVTGKRKVYA